MGNEIIDALPYRRSVRLRLAEIMDFIRPRDTFSRKEIAEAVEVSMPQASIDLAILKAALPGAFRFDSQKRVYVVNRETAEQGAR